MVKEASGDPYFERYVQPIMYWTGSGPLSQAHTAEILNSANQLLAYLDTAIGPEEAIMERDPRANPPQTINIHLGDNSPISGNVVVAQSVENSFNKAESADISNELKDLLQRLAKEVAGISTALPEETAEEVARDLDTLTAEAISKNPRKRWWQMSAEGLQQAAEKLGKIGKPMLELVVMVVSLLEKK